MTIAVISMIRDPWGGSEELWADMARAAIEKGHTVVHLGYETTTTHPKMHALQELGVLSFKRPGLVKAAGGSLQYFAEVGINFIRKKIKNHFTPLFSLKPDIILYNGTCYSIASEQQLMKELSRNSTAFFLLGHLNSDIFRDINDKQAASVRRAYSLAKKVFFVSKRNWQTAERHLCINISNAAIVRNPVNLPDTSPVPFPAFDDGIKMAVVGNLATIHKGQDILVQVLAGQQWRRRNWQLNIYGSGYDEQYLRNLVSHLGLADHVTFHGLVRNIKRVWQDNHLLVLPSHMEGMPLAVVEAMICARPCLVSDVGGNTEWITDNETGFVTPVASLSSLTETLERAWQMQANWQQMGQLAHKRAISLYDANAGKTLLNILETHYAA